MNKNIAYKLLYKTNIKRIVLVLLILTLPILTSGCRLANTEKNLANDEKLIGVLVVFDEDLKGYEMMDGDTLYNQEKKLVRKDGTTKYLTDEEMKRLTGGSEIIGVKQKNGTYKFGDIDGYYMGYTQKITKEYNAPCIASGTMSSDDIYDMHVAHNSNSNVDFTQTFKRNEEPQMKEKITEQSVTVEGTIPVNCFKNRTVELIRVHQRSNGEVYINVPAGPSLSLQAADAGSGMSGISISEDYQSSMKSMGLLAENAKESITYKVNFNPVNTLQSAKAIEMNQNNQVVKSTDIKFSSRQLNLKLDQKTDYVIIEETFADRAGNTYQKRTAYDCEQISGEEWRNGNIHTFDKTMENGKVQRIILTFVR